MKNKISGIVKFFNENYKTNNELVCKLLTFYIHSSHRDRSNQPSWPMSIVKAYAIFYDPNSRSNHKAGKIRLYFTDGCITNIGLFKFKRYIRRLYKYGKFL